MADDDFAIRELLRKREYLFEERARLVKADGEHWNSHDQAILTLSSAILGVSFAFVKDVPKPILATPALYTAWSALIAAVVFTFISFRFASRVTRRDIAQVDQELAAIGQSGAAPRGDSPDVLILRWLNNLSGSAFVLGLILLFVFTVSNLRSSEVTVKSSSTAPALNAPGRGTPPIAPAPFPTVTPAQQQPASAPAPSQPAPSPPTPAPSK